MILSKIYVRKMHPFHAIIIDVFFSVQGENMVDTFFGGHKQTNRQTPTWRGYRGSLEGKKRIKSSSSIRKKFNFMNSPIMLTTGIELC